MSNVSFVQKVSLALLVIPIILLSRVLDKIKYIYNLVAYVALD